MTVATLEDALELVAKKFHGIKDKAGQPYILHLLRVMLRQSEDYARQVALMHDLVEDTDVSLDDLRRLGYAEPVVDGVDAVTHRSSETYAEYVLRAASNPIGRAVKVADLQDNYSLDRVAYRQDHREDDARRIQKYILSISS